MSLSRSLLALVTTAFAAAPLQSQSVTTAGVLGTVRMSDGSDPGEARVAVRNTATGFTVESGVRHGRFLIQGLEIGGPYTLIVRRIGARPERRNLGFLSLGQPVVLDLVLEPVPVVLDSLVATAAPFPRSNANGGTATTISDSLLRHLPTLNRDIYDFIRLVPQISTRVGLGSGGMSGGGVGFRFNQFLTNGVPQRSLAGSQPPEFAGGKSLPFEAVAEYQVLVAPFDVRYGDFAGAAVNAVTRSGTNELHGSLLAQYRSDALARDDSLPYRRAVFGVSLSGPLARDRAHFFVAAELQRLTAPMAGPYLGQPADASSPFPVREADLTRLDAVMRRIWGLRAGSAGPVENRNPLGNLFARIDSRLPLGNSRAVLWVSNAESDNLAFARSARDTSFALSSRAASSGGDTWTAALQLHTALQRNGGHHEFFVSRRTIQTRSDPEVRQPIVGVAVPRASGPGTITLLTGTPIQLQGQDAWYSNFDLRDNLTLPLGRAHILTLGAEAEWFRLEPGALLNAYGTWNFQSLDSLAAGVAERFEVTRDLGAARLPLTGGQYATYAGDHWQLDERLALSFGVRADLLDVHGHPPYNGFVDSVFGRRTDRFPPTQVQWSSRFGFTWAPDAAGRNQLRGGAGIFTGRPPLAWFQAALQNYGTGTSVLRCGSGGQGPSPAFEPNPLAPPAACAGGAAATPPGDVELLSPKLRMARTLRVALAWDRRLPHDLLATAEALFTRNLADFMFVNLNLVGPQSIDRFGRTLYGSFDAAGRATAARRAPSLPSVIDLQNVSANWSSQLSARLEKRFAAGFSALASYTWTRVRDVQTPLRVNTRGVVNWSSRALSGRHEDLHAGISLNDIPHRLVLAGTWRGPWRRWATELSLLYVGESGAPFTYLVTGASRFGDLNADGSNLNDPI
jgi:hypothetical protein